MESASSLPILHLRFGSGDNNPDIADYRGYSEITAIFGKNDRVALSVTGRLGRAGHKGSLEADLTIPVHFDKLFDFATYVLIQYWNGYGESLRDVRQADFNYSRRILAGTLKNSIRPSSRGRACGNRARCG